MLLVCQWLLFCLGAQAQEREPAPLVELNWRAPPSCGDASQVQARVQQLVGAAHVSATTLQADANVEARADGSLQLRLLIRADGRVGERQFSAKSCEDLIGAAAVALALVLREAEPTAAPPGGENAAADAAPPSSVEGGAQVAPDTPAAPASGREAKAESDAPPPSAKTPRTRLAQVLLQGPNALFGVGPLPAPSIGFGIAAGAAVRRWRVLADGVVWLPQRVSAVHEGERNGADVQRFTAGARVCHAFVWSRFQLAPCAAVSMEHLSARGSGAHVEPETAKATWCAVGAGAEVRVDMVRWLSLVGAVDVLGQTSRPTLTIDDAGALAQLRPVAVVFKLGLEWIL